MCIADLRAKIEELRTCLDELEHSQALEKLIPGIFDDGQSIRTRWRRMQDGTFFFDVMYQGEWRPFSTRDVPPAIRATKPCLERYHETPVQTALRGLNG